MQLNADQRQLTTICRQLTIVLKYFRRVSSRRRARSPGGERAHRLDRTIRLQQEACMQLRFQRQLITICHQLTIVSQASEL